MTNYSPEFAGRMEQFVLDGLVQRGMPEHVAQGFVMNFKDESGLNPGINEAAPIVPGSRGGYGFAQWTGPRRRNLEAFAQSRGLPVSDPGLQLDFLMTELQGPERAAYDAMLQTGTPQDAAVAIVNKFERPAEEHRARRVAAYSGAQAPMSAGGQNVLGLGGAGPAAAVSENASKIDKLQLINMLGGFQQPESSYNFLMG